MIRLLTALALPGISALPTLSAQEDFTDQAGILQVMNLVSLKTPTYMSLDAFKFNRGEPVEIGSGSGSLALRPGELTFSIANPGAKPATATLPINIENGKSVVVICYDEVKSFKDGSEEARLRFSVLTEAPPTTVPELTLVSLMTEESISLSIEGRPYRVKPKSPVDIDIADKETVAIKSGKKTLIDFESERPGHYIVFLFQDPEAGEPSASLVHNETLEYHPPREEDDEDPDQ
ncbi:MAG: hypothetical protein P1U68_01800 [Verrucomicrobiales bacterium]|nr:hypothetical protein [Verrucomicrobiales bacterium]